MLRAGLALMLLAAPVAAAAQAPDYGADLERFEYPYPVHWFETRSQGSPVRMAYLDVRPAAEYAAAHLPGAVHIPLPELAERLGELRRHL